MRPARRTAPARRLAPAPGHRLAATLTALLAVLLILVPAWPAAGAGITVPVPGTAPVPAATTVPHPDSGYHADHGWATTCAAQARARHDHLGERPAPPDRLGTTPRASGTAPAAHGRTSAGPGPVPVSPGRTSHDRGRAPPVSSGT